MKSVRFSAADKVTALRREINKRRAVYAGKIGKGMSVQKAQHEIGVMEAILRDYLQCALCGLTMADWHDPEPIAGNPEARKAVQLVECEADGSTSGVFVCTKCKAISEIDDRG